MKQVLIASAFAATVLSAGAASAAENSQPAAQPQAQVQVLASAQPGPVAAAAQTTTVAPVYEVPGRENRAGSIYFGH